MKKWLKGWFRLPLDMHRLLRETAGLHDAFRLTLGVLQQINERTVRIMHTLDDILTEVRAQRTLIQSIDALMDGMRGQISAAVSAASSTADAQQRIEAIFNETQANRAALTAAIEENTPATAPSTGAQEGSSGATGSTSNESGDAGSAAGSSSASSGSEQQP